VSDVTEQRFDIRKHEVAYWEAHLIELAGDFSKPTLAIGRQRLRQWCASNGGLTAAELRTYLEDVQGVLRQAGVRQGLLRRPSRQQGPDDDTPPRPRLRIIK
jgi:hypothetical protein